MSQPTKLTEFRNELYSTLPHRRDAGMELLDAMCSSTQSGSVVELSLEPAFRRRHSSVHAAIARHFEPSAPHLEAAERAALERRLRYVVARVLDPPAAEDWWHLSLDMLPLARPHARCLDDRSWVYQPQAVPGLTPVTVGHRYSMLAALPRRDPKEPPWTVPLSIRRVPADAVTIQDAVKQVREVLDDPPAPWYEAPVVLTADSGYASAAFLSPLRPFERLVVVTRLRGNRVLFRVAPPRQPGKRGRPMRYGERFALRDRSTWGPPDAVVNRPHGDAGDVLRIEAWHDLLMKGAKGAPMHAAPLTLLRCTVACADGTLRPRSLKWLIVSGDRRHALDPKTAATLYRFRFDIEHGIRFAKQHLHLADFQTCVTEHEESWLTYVGLAMAQLYAARGLAIALPRPWEARRTQETAPAPTTGQARAAPSATSPRLTPSLVQRDFNRILAAIGTPARSPKPRGNPAGRALGECPERRRRYPVRKKAPPVRQRARAPAAQAA